MRSIMKRRRGAGQRWLAAMEALGRAPAHHPLCPLEAAEVENGANAAVPAAWRKNAREVMQSLDLEVKAVRKGDNLVLDWEENEINQVGTQPITVSTGMVNLKQIFADQLQQMQQQLDAHEAKLNAHEAELKQRDALVLFRELAKRVRDRYLVPAPQVSLKDKFAHMMGVGKPSLEHMLKSNNKTCDDFLLVCKLCDISNVCFHPTHPSSYNDLQMFLDTHPEIVVTYTPTTPGATPVVEDFRSFFTELLAWGQQLNINTSAQIKTFAL